MKRWIAGIMAAVLLAACTPVGAGEAPAGKSGTLAENLGFLREMADNEDVRSLIQIQDVQDLMTEVVAQVVIWMVQNRPVTMDILAELGVGETDLRCIGRIWDSAERIRDAWQAYFETEDGRRLAAEMEAAQRDPEIQEALDNFLDMCTREDISGISAAIGETVREGIRDDMQEGLLTPETVGRRIDRSTLIGSLLLCLKELVKNSEWARSSVPKLAENENLWNLMGHLSELSWADDIMREEVSKLADDPEINDFVQRTAGELIDLIQGYRDSGKAPVPDGESSGAGEEETP